MLHVIEVASGKETGEAIDRAQFGPPAWDDSNRLLYNRLQKLASGAPKSDKYLKSRAYVHTIGTDPGTDRAILGPGVSADVTTDPLAVPFIVTAPGSPYVIGGISQRQSARAHSQRRVRRRRSRREFRRGAASRASTTR